MIAAIVASSLIHLSSPSPAEQLEQVERAAPFHVMVMSPGGQLLGARLLRDGAGEVDARLEYATGSGEVVDIDERLPEASDTEMTPPPNSTTFDLDGYPASYEQSSESYRRYSSLTWYRTDLIVTVSSRDEVNEPMLVDIVLELA
jgi:hypothetical protein